MPRRKPATKSPDKFERDIQAIIADYEAATGNMDWTRDDIAAWAIKNEKWEQRPISAIRELSKIIGRVARQVTFIDDDGNEVRKYHSYQLGEGQPRLWSSIDLITPESMTASINDRRDKLVDGAVKIVIDTEYFNDKHNPGDAIAVELDLTRDVKEKRQPGLYDDLPPEDSEPV